MASNCETTETEFPSICCDCLTAEAEYWCNTCNNAYCEICCKEVHQRRAFSNHQTTLIGAKSVEVVKCQIHNNQSIKYWCHTCEILACVKCLVAEHKNHKCALVETVAKDVSTEVRSNLEQVQSSLNDNMKHVVEMIGETEKMNTEIITNTFELLRMIINEEEKALKQQILEVEIKNKTTIEEYQTQLKSKEQDLNEKKLYFESIVLANDHVKLIQTKEQLINHSNEITKELDELKPPIKTEYQLNGIDQFQANIDDLIKQIHIVVHTTSIFSTYSHPFIMNSRIRLISTTSR